MTESRIKDLLRDGEACVQAEEYEEALDLYRTAVGLVPEPFAEQELSTRLLAAIGEVYWRQRDYEKAKRAFWDVMDCPGAAQDDRIRLRRGQIALELGDEGSAVEELACAYLNTDGRIFKGEDTRYLVFIQDAMKEDS